MKELRVWQLHSEKKPKGRRDWQGQRAEQQAVYETGDECGASTAKSLLDGAGE